MTVIVYGSKDTLEETVRVDLKERRGVFTDIFPYNITTYWMYNNTSLLIEYVMLVMDNNQTINFFNFIVY